MGCCCCCEEEIPNHLVPLVLQTKDRAGRILRSRQLTVGYVLSYYDYKDHLALLRTVRQHPELTQVGPRLSWAVQAYCRAMADGTIANLSGPGAKPLSLEVEWIWHIHRLHPQSYRQDCATQLGGAVVDKRTHCFEYVANVQPTATSTIRRIAGETIELQDVDVKQQQQQPRMTFQPSIDLVQAATRQRKFLESLRTEYWNTKRLGSHYGQQRFDEAVVRYYRFLKLARAWPKVPKGKVVRNRKTSSGKTDR